MPDTKISLLTDGVTALGTDQIPVARSGTNVKITPAYIKTLFALSGTNTGDQTSIVGITGTTAQFNTALTDNDFATLAGAESLSNKALVGPALGTPISGVMTNVTGTAAGLTAGNVTTNANLTGGVTSVGNAATVVTNANLTGGVTSVGNAATVVTNANLTGGVTSVGNAATVVTNANLTGGVTSVGNAATVVTNANLTGHITSTGNAAVLGSFTSAQLATALTDETGTGANVFANSPALVTPVLGTPTSGNLSSCTADGTDAVGFRNVPQNSQSTAYTAVLADAGKHVLHPSADTTARTYTIPANASVAYVVGTAITFVNQNAGGVITIAITTDTMRLAGAGTTGSRTLAANGIATALKVTSTEWIISGTGLT